MIWESMRRRKVLSWRYCLVTGLVQQK